jgi:hypothetical protein
MPHKVKLVHSHLSGNKHTSLNPENVLSLSEKRRLILVCFITYKMATSIPGKSCSTFVHVSFFDVENDKNKYCHLSTNMFPHDF